MQEDQLRNNSVTWAKDKEDLSQVRDSRNRGGKGEVEHYSLKKGKLGQF